MITIRPSQTFTAILEGAPTGLTGTLQIRIEDVYTTAVFGPTTAGIFEYAPATGVYAKEDMVSPALEGNYVILWDDGATYAVEELVVSGGAGGGGGGGTGTSVASLVDRVRRQMRDWRDQDSAANEVSELAGEVDVADSSRYYVNETIQIESEAMVVRSLATATRLGVERGAYGTTPATHPSGTPILMNPRFLNIEIVDALADALDAAFPYIYYRVLDTSLRADDSLYEYDIPVGNNNTPIPFIHKIETQEAGELTPWQVRNWQIIRDNTTNTPMLKFRITQPGGATIRIQGYDYFPRLDAGSSLDAGWPVNMEYPMVMYACSLLLASGEFYRVSVDRGAIDDREQANKVGASMAASQYGLQWYLRRVQNSGFPPMSKHVRPVT